MAITRAAIGVRATATAITAIRARTTATHTATTGRVWRSASVRSGSGCSRIAAAIRRAGTLVPAISRCIQWYTHSGSGARLLPCVAGTSVPALRTAPTSYRRGLPLAHVDELAGDRGSRRHRGRDEVRAALVALP